MLDSRSEIRVLGVGSSVDRRMVASSIAFVSDGWNCCDSSLQEESDYRQDRCKGPQQ
jgi:hypothetical protein